MKKTFVRVETKINKITGSGTVNVWKSGKLTFHKDFYVSASPLKKMQEWHSRDNFVRLSHDYFDSKKTT